MVVTNLLREINIQFKENQDISYDFEVNSINKTSLIYHLTLELVIHKLNVFWDDLVKSFKLTRKKGGKQVSDF